MVTKGNQKVNKTPTISCQKVHFQQIKHCYRLFSKGGHKIGALQIKECFNSTI